MAVLVAFLLGGLGFFTSRPFLLQWLNTQNPILAFLLWYVLLFSFVQLGSLLIFHRLDYTTLRLGIGILVIAFAGGIVLYWPASTYSLNVVGATQAGTPSFLIASEDQLVYSFWQFFLPFASNDALGILTYAITPALLVLIAGLFVAPRQFSAAFRGLLRTA